MEMRNDLPIHFFANVGEWQNWLNEHYGQTSGVWLKFAKKSAEEPSVTYDEALDVALCYGWIDGQVNRYDEQYYLQKFTPRRPKSVWSKRNVSKVAELMEAGKMQPAGLAQVEAAKQDGRWQLAYDSPGKMGVPDDFKTALEHDPKARAFFETLNRTNRYSFLWRIQTAKNPETRKTRIEKLIQMLREGKTFHP